MNINKEQALKRLRAIEEETKELRSIIDKKDDWTSVTDIESACKWLGEYDQDVEEYRFMVGTKAFKFSNKTINQKALEICIKAINTENNKTWEPDWDNQNEKKWYNWFEKKRSGWSVVVSGPFFYCYRSDRGAGFYFQSEKKASHGANHFKKYYDIWLG